VAVADNERIHPGDIDLQNFEVVRVNAGLEAEVEQVATDLGLLGGHFLDPDHVRASC
jgi:hypothetical protein